MKPVKVSSRNPSFDLWLGFCLVLLLLNNPLAKAEGITELTLKEAIQLALENDPQISDLQAKLDSSQLELDQLQAIYRFQLLLDAKPASLSYRSRSSDISTKEDKNVFSSELSLEGSISFPSNLDLTGEITLNRSDATEDQGWDLLWNIGVKQDLLSNPAYSESALNTMQKRMETEKTQDNLEQQKKLTVIDMRQKYFDLVIKEEQYLNSQEDHELAQRELEKTKREREVSAVGDIDLLKSEIEERKAYKTMLAARDAHLSQLRGLELLLGISLTGLRILDLELGEFSSWGLSEEETISRALANSIDLKSLELDIKLAEARLEAEKRGSWPDLFLQAQYAKQEGEELGEEDIYNWQISLNLTYSIFDGERQRDAIELKEIAYEEAKRNYEDSKSQVEDTTRDKLASLEDKSREIEIAYLSQDEAELEKALKEEQLKEGLITQDEYQRAVNRSKEAQLDLQQAINDCQAEELRLKVSIGEELELGGEIN